ncbi:MAG: glycosyltransferase family 2 protein [Kiritimatiellae bacterium]|nr:glycosyltransferase family 2 protein [Kiritimatiellia bacterium]MDW8459544.1 glycosyltransferase family 2 protein [Verrucomicrobiota bacterium]
MTATRPEHFTLGIVIPCYNEEEVLPKLLAALEKFIGEAPYAIRVLFVDDGSRDRTEELLCAACSRQPAYAYLRFSRNFGHQTAVTAGLAHIPGEVIGVIDADLQDPLEALAGMVEKWRAGYDVVYGVRKNRKEGLLLRFAYAAFYRLLKKMANIEIPLDSGDFCVMDRRVVDVINAMPEHNRFIRGLRGWAGFRQIGFPYDRAARAAGKTKYTISRLLKLAFDGMISFSSVPLRLASLLGVLAALLGMVYLGYAVVVKILDPAAPIGWASTIAVIIFFGGIQLIVLGIIGEYLGRIFDETKRRPLYLIDRTGGWLGGTAPR